MADQYFGDLAELSVDGNPITIGASSKVGRTWKKATAPATWAKPEVTKPVSYLDQITIPFSDMDDHAEFLVLWNLAAAKAAVPVILYPEGNTAGKQTWNGNAYVEIDGIDLGIEKAAGGTITLNFTGGMTPSPNLVLNSQVCTAGQAGQAYAGFTFTTTGGTATYAYDVLTFAGTTFPVEGLTFTNGVIAGTPNANAPVGTHYFYMTVTDSAATPVVKTFLCSIVIAAA